MITLDFETRSHADLKKVGAWMYSKHPSTEVLCLKWKMNGESGFYHCAHPWTEASPPPTRLFELIAEGYKVEAHNAMFEFCIWRHVCVQKMGWPEVRDSQWSCSAAKAAANCVPRSLDGAGNAVGAVVVKDTDKGKRVLTKVSRPAKPTKAEPDRKWHEKQDDILELWDYNNTDVDAEEALSKMLMSLSDKEHKVWVMDQRMNRRGVACDTEGCKKAIVLATKHTERLNNVVYGLTQEAVDRATKRDKVLEWLHSRGHHHIVDTTAETLDHEIWKMERADVYPTERRVMEIVKEVGRTSTKKYGAMLAMSDVDHRIRDTMMYHGASTGRWAGKGIQPHNYPRACPKNMEFAWDVIHMDDPDMALEVIETIYGDVMKFLSSTLRGALWAPRGRRLYCADYSAIEARVTLWMAGDEDGLDIFRRGEDIYVDMASTIYGRILTKENEEERQLGKQAILGLGFGMGFIKFLITCRGYNMKFPQSLIDAIVPRGWYNATAEWLTKTKGRDNPWSKVLSMIPDASELDVPELVFMKYVVDKYRARFTKVVEGWYALERTVIQAALPENHGKIFSSFKTQWCYLKHPFPALKCRLPSGRLMTYPFAEVQWVKHKKKTEWGEEEISVPKMTYMGVNPHTKQWDRLGTYGGKLVENVVQATARDVMADAMLRCDESIYEPVLSVHDEIVAETAENEGDLKEFFALVSQVPEWAPGLPVGVSGWTGRRYRK